MTNLLFPPIRFVTLTNRLLYLILLRARPLGCFGFSCFSTFGVWDLTFPARASEPWTFQINIISPSHQHRWRERFRLQHRPGRLSTDLSHIVELRVIARMRWAVVNLSYAVWSSSCTTEKWKMWAPPCFSAMWRLAVLIVGRYSNLQCHRIRLIY